MSRTIKLAITSFVFIFIVSCGGGGGGGSPISTVQTSTTPVATPSVTISDLQDYPTTGNYDYGSDSIVFGKFGSTTANCYLNQNITRGAQSLSNPSLPDAPTYVYCQQTEVALKKSANNYLGSNYMLMVAIR